MSKPITKRTKHRFHITTASVVDKPLVTPNANEQYVLRSAYLKVRDIASEPDALSIKLDNGTTDTVVDTQVGLSAGFVQRLPVTGNVVIDNDNPLTVSITLEGSTDMNLALTLFLDRISGED